MKVDSIIQHYIGANTYIVHLTDNDVIIIDAGANLDPVVTMVKDCSVHGIFITHAHFDHILSLQDYLNTFHCPLYISENGMQKLTNGADNLSEMFLGIDLKVDVNNDVIIVHDRDVLEIAGQRITVIETQGHSNCSMTYLIDGMLFVGDVVFSDGRGRTDFFDSSEKDLLESVAKLKKISYNHVYPGHGKDFNKITE